MSVTVKITSQKSNTTKSFRFPIDFTIAEVIRECRGMGLTSQLKLVFVFIP
jgi:hypothetical protein